MQHLPGDDQNGRPTITTTNRAAATIPGRKLHPAKQETLEQCWVNVGPTSTQHCFNVSCLPGLNDCGGLMLDKISNVESVLTPQLHNDFYFLESQSVILLWEGNHIGK